MPHRPTTRLPIRVRTYDGLAPWTDGFRDGRFNLLWLTGGPGLGKSWAVRSALADREFLLVEGHATPLRMYADLYRHRDRPVVIDDEDSFHAMPLKVQLMKCLCGTEAVKRLAWGSTARVLDELGLPPSFETTSKVAVLTNRMAAVSAAVAPLLDRGCVLAFEPSAAEVHRRVGTWFRDGEILAFFERWLGVIEAPSMRLYVIAAEMKAAGIDWREALMGLWEAGDLWRIDAVQRDPALSTEKQRSAQFAARGGGSRATYFRHLARWRQMFEGVSAPATEPDAATDGD